VGGEPAQADHPRQVAGRLQVRELEPARSPDAKQVRVARDHAQHPSLAQDRNGLDPHRDVVTPLRIALPRDPTLIEGRVEQRPTAARDERADQIVDEGGRSGRGTYLRTAPVAVAVAVGEPQNEVREGQVGDDLPVGDEQV
jgi:hypothetical protein